MTLWEALKERFGWRPQVPRRQSMALQLQFARQTAPAIALIAVIAGGVTLVGLKLDYDRRVAVPWFHEYAGFEQSFLEVEDLTPPGSVIFCWWDYGRGVEEVGHRVAVETLPSREIWETTGASRDTLYNLEQQLYGSWGSNDRIETLARAFTLAEDEALPLMKQVNATYGLVFYPDDAQKFEHIARIAGLKPEEYMSLEGTYVPTDKGLQLTLLRLLYDARAQPKHFEKLCDDGRARLFRIIYPA